MTEVFVSFLCRSRHIPGQYLFLRHPLVVHYSSVAPPFDVTNSVLWPKLLHSHLQNEFTPMTLLLSFSPLSHSCHTVTLAILFQLREAQFQTRSRRSAILRYLFMSVCTSPRHSHDILVLRLTQLLFNVVVPFYSTQCTQRCQMN